MYEALIKYDCDFEIYRDDIDSFEVMINMMGYRTECRYVMGYFNIVLPNVDDYVIFTIKVRGIHDCLVQESLLVPDERFVNDTSTYNFPCDFVDALNLVLRYL